MFDKNLEFEAQGRELFETIRAGDLASWESIEPGERWAWRELSRLSLIVYTLVGYDDAKNAELAERTFSGLVGGLLAHRATSTEPEVGAARPTQPPIASPTPLEMVTKQLHDALTPKERAILRNERMIPETERRAIDAHPEADTSRELAMPARSAVGLAVAMGMGMWEAGRRARMLAEDREWEANVERVEANVEQAQAPIELQRARSNWPSLRTCNRHADCNAARAGDHCCHDDCCEDCFGS